ncbi:MAG: Type 1 glutamine amidotransferase-like domain-containing protein [Bacilli bacterium]|nr:Type 1 glutamine amidotransferase-like domain-containing protein [Bacilli bacterium]
MKLYLSSYKVGNNMGELKKWISEHDNNILVIPNALDVFPDGERKTNGILEKSKELEVLGFNPVQLDLRNYFNKPEQLKKEIKDFKAFYVLGGNIFVLRRAMRLSGFDNYLREIATDPDYLYSGFSAGICVLANDLHGIHLADEPEQDPYNYGEIIWEGIGLIDYMPVPHYDTPEHPESHLMYDVVTYLENHNLKYQTLKDGDVIIEDLNTLDTNLNKKTR